MIAFIKSKLVRLNPFFNWISSHFESVFFIMQENITYRRNIKKYLFVDLYNVPCTIRAIGKILTTQNIKK